MDHPVKTYRIEHGLSQGQLGQQLDVSRETVARWELGIRKIGKARLPLISEKTGIAPKDLRPDLAELFEAAQ